MAFWVFTALLLSLPAPGDVSRPADPAVPHLEATATDVGTSVAPPAAFSAPWSGPTATPDPRPRCGSRAPDAPPPHAPPASAHNRARAIAAAYRLYGQSLVRIRSNVPITLSHPPPRTAT